MISPEEHLNCKVHDRRAALTVTRPCRRPVPVTYNASPRNATSPLAQSNLHSICCIMSTKDQLLHSALHGTAMRYAVERRDLAESIAELREIADGRNYILAEAAGITAGSWYACRSRWRPSSQWGSLPAVTVRVTAAASEVRLPSSARYANESLPLKLASGR